MVSVFSWAHLTLRSRNHAMIKACLPPMANHPHQNSSLYVGLSNAWALNMMPIMSSLIHFPISGPANRPISLNFPKKLNLVATERSLL